MLISPEYAALNRTLHERPSYGASGHLWAWMVSSLHYITNSDDVLDYGCGKSTLAKSLGIAIREYDPAINGKEDPPEPADIVICTDVLEHIEPASLKEVLRHIRQLTVRCAFLTMATRPAHKTLPDGRNAHLIIEDKLWWENKLSELFDLIEIAPQQDEEYAVIAIPRRTP